MKFVKSLIAIAKSENSYIDTGRGSPEMYLSVSKYLRGYAGIFPKDTRAIIALLKNLILNLI